MFFNKKKAEKERKIILCKNLKKLNFYNLKKRKEQEKKMLVFIKRKEENFLSMIRKIKPCENNVKIKYLITDK